LRVVLQRVSRAEVRVDGEVVGHIAKGLVLLAAFHASDRREDLQWMARKCVELRIFRDDEGKMNRSLKEAGGAVLLVSQFTLYGDARKGRRPSFVASAPPELAQPLYEEFAGRLREQGVEVETGVFGAMMEVELVGDGPVTLILSHESEKRGTPRGEDLDREETT
jgi:D-tyrosyl-tRNA(Tyr) deacylase